MTTTCIAPTTENRAPCIRLHGHAESYVRAERRHEISAEDRAAGACPNCRKRGACSRREVARGYQCIDCTRAEESGY